MELTGLIVTILGVVIMGLIAAAIVAVAIFVIKWGLVLILAGTATNFAKLAWGKNKKSTKRKKGS